MTQENSKSEQTQGAQAGSQGQHGKGQSNPGGFDQQSSSSMEREQADKDRMRHQQQQQSRSEGNEEA
jgi:hypothetical protein